MRRGDVLVVDFGSQQGSEAGSRRAAVIVTNDAANATAERLGRGTVAVVPLTTNVETVLTFHVLLDAGSAGLPRDSKAQAEHVRSVAVNRLTERLGRVPAATMQRIDRALRVHLSL
jgi:mRNA interferase MazF